MLWSVSDGNGRQVGTQLISVGELRILIQEWYDVMSIVHKYDTFPAAKHTQHEVLAQKITNISERLRDIYKAARMPNTLPMIPPEVIQYVDNSRNPDIYTREFMEVTRKSNQLLKGKQEAFGSFTDIFAQEMAKAMPECRADIEAILDATGRDKQILNQES